MKDNDKSKIVTLGLLLLWFPYLFIEDIYIIGFVMKMFMAFGIGSAIGTLLWQIINE